MSLNLLNQIKNGYSLKSGFYFKHPDLNDLNSIQEYRERKFLDCKNKGLLTSDEKLKLAIELGQWSDQDNNELSIIDTEIQSLEMSLSKLALVQQKQIMKKKICQAKERKNNILKKKESITFQSAEYYADYWAFHHQLFLLTFKDFSLKTKFWNKEEFDELDGDELNSLEQSYIEYSNDLTDTQIKKIAVLPFFRNIYAIANSSESLFKKAALDLTYPQIRLINFAKTFDLIFKNSKNIPPHLNEDPEALEEWFISNQQGANQVKNKANPFQSNLLSNIKEKGSLGMNDLKKVF